MALKTDILSPAAIAKLILSVRGHKVMLDADLARLYGVTTANLNKAVKRNINRFPGDFVFQLTMEEASALSFQNGIPKLAAEEGVGICPTFLPNRASQCCRVFSEAAAQLKSTLKLCGLSSD